VNRVSKVTKQVKSKKSNPVIWLLMGHRGGDNGQLRALARMISTKTGPEIVEKKVFYNMHRSWPGAVKREDLKSVDMNRSDELTGPWPDVVIGIGRRSVPVSRWIKAQSGGKTKIIRFGNPKIDPDNFDLVITSPQYDVRDGENVLRLEMPISGLYDANLKTEGENFKHIIEGLPGPHIGLIVGGPSWSYDFGKKEARILAAQAEEYAKSVGGSLLITTSSRTPLECDKVIRENVNIPSFMHMYGGDTEDNPYRGILALSDEVIVTCDSASMISDIVTAKKPILLFEMRKSIVSKFGKSPQKMGRLHRALIESGLARWLSKDAKLPKKDGEHSDFATISEVVKAVKGLLK